MNDEFYMQRCLDLASNGLGHTYPNPLVGCVIVLNNKIIGEGWHHKAGEPHAEVNAINSVEDPSKLSEATLYVNLEPCSHYGKTPPCCDLIIAKGIKKVVIGTVDPNPKVAGKSIMKLMHHCKELTVGCLEDECDELNKRFFMGQRQQRPYVILKWAESADGFLAPKKQPKGQPVWITNAYSKQLIHKWRSEEQAILVGKNTAIKDNPALTTRLWDGPNPTRILIDRELSCFSSPQPLHLLDQKDKTIIYCERTEQSQPNLIFEELDFDADIAPQILDNLYSKHNIQSVIVEGGAFTLSSFINSDLWDEARVFVGDIYFKDGIKAPQLTVSPSAKLALENDILKVYHYD